MTVTHEPDTGTDHEPTNTRKPPSPLKRQLLAAATGLTVVASIVAARHSDVLRGGVALVLALALILVIPTSSLLSRRVAFNLALMIGWLPVLWWFPALVSLPTGRVTWILAVVAGLLAAWVTAWPRTWRAIIPQLRPIDALPWVAGVATAWVGQPLLGANSGEQTLPLLMRSGWDHVAHVNMVQMIRQQGAAIFALGPAPDGTAWKFTEYPQHFHTLMASIAELTTGSVAGDAATEVLRYGRSLVLIQVLTVVLLASALCAIPQLRRRPSVAMPGVALVWAAFTMGPGSLAFTAGYPNFVLGAACAATVPLIAVTLPRVFTPIPLAVLGGLLVATAHCWLLLTPLAAVGLAPLIWPYGRSRWQARRPDVWVAVVLVILSGVGVLVAVWQVTRVGQSAESILNIGGSAGFEAVHFFLVAAGICLALGLRASGPFAALTAVPLAAGLITAGLMAMQIRSIGTVTYYSLKFMTGALLVSLVVAVAAAAGPRRRHPIGGIRSAVVVAVLTLVATQVFGYVGPRGRQYGLSEAPGLRYRADAAVLSAGPSNESSQVLASLPVADREPWGSAVYLAAGEGAVVPSLAAQWFRSLSGTWSQGHEAAYAFLDNLGAPFNGNLDTVAAAAKELLTVDPAIVVVVLTDDRDAVRARLNDPVLAARVVSA